MSWPRVNNTSGIPGLLTVTDAKLGYAALAALSGMLPPGTRLARTVTVESGAPLAMWEPTTVAHPTTLRAAMSTVELAMQPLPTIDQLAARWSGIDPVSLEERLRRARSIRASYGGATTIRYPVWCWKLGDSYLVAHPGEAYSPLQQELRKRFGSAVAVLNLSNGPGFFYFPTESAYSAGAYQAWQTLVDRDALPALIETASSLLAELGLARHKHVGWSSSCPTNERSRFARSGAELKGHSPLQDSEGGHYGA